MQTRLFYKGISSIKRLWTRQALRSWTSLLASPQASPQTVAAIALAAAGWSAAIVTALQGFGQAAAAGAAAAGDEDELQYDAPPDGAGLSNEGEDLRLMDLKGEREMWAPLHTSRQRRLRSLAGLAVAAVCPLLISSLFFPLLVLEDLHAPSLLHFVSSPFSSPPLQGCMPCALTTINSAAPKACVS